MATRESPKYCTAEGADTSSALLALMRPHVATFGSKSTSPVWVEASSSVQRSLKRSEIVAQYQASGRTHLAYVVDAEGSWSGVWGRLRDFAEGRFAEIPSTMPSNGLVLTALDGKKFGAWIMPTNQSDGMLEDFLRLLVPMGADPLWGHAVASVGAARTNFGAPCKDIHLPKAHLYTWLGFQDPPGQSYGPAIANKTLDATHATALAFVDWFRRMFDV